MSNKSNRYKRKLLVEQAMRKNQEVRLKKLAEKKALLDAIFIGNGSTTLKVVNDKNVTVTANGFFERVDLENNEVVFRIVPELFPRIGA